MGRMKMTAEASINGGDFHAAEVRFDEAVDWIRSENAVMPDPAWEHTDSNGHFHAFAEGGKTPTLREHSVHVDCDGSCGGVCEGEGYDEPRWKCVICGEEVKPAFIPDLAARTTGIPVVTSRSATVTVRGEGSLPAIGQQDNGDETFTLGTGPNQVSVRVRAQGGEMIGTGYTDVSMSMSRAAGVAWTVRIVGRLDPRLPQANLERVP